MAPRPWQRALVTGASSGIGAHTARLVARRGGDVVLVARSTETLEELADELRAAGREAEVLGADLTDPDDRAAVEARVEDAERPVDLLVNNAGFGSFGQFWTLDRDGEGDEVTLNVLAVVRLAHAAAAAMVSRGGGGILNVASVAGFQPVPRNTTYSASKAFVLTFSEALHEELRPQGVHVTALCPGFTRTSFTESAGVSDTAEQVPEVAWMSAEEVAEAGLDGVTRNRAVVVPGLGYRAVVASSSLAPRALKRRLGGLVMDRIPGL